MLVQLNSDNVVPLESDASDRLETMVRARLDRYASRLTRVEVHVGDVNGAKSGAGDIRCMIEARPNGLDPVGVTETAADVEAAVAGALAKSLTALERTFGRLTDRKGH